MTCPSIQPCFSSFPSAKTPDELLAHKLGRCCHIHGGQRLHWLSTLTTLPEKGARPSHCNPAPVEKTTAWLHLLESLSSVCSPSEQKPEHRNPWPIKVAGSCPSSSTYWSKIQPVTILVISKPKPSLHHDPRYCHLPSIMGGVSLLQSGQERGRGIGR